jgi:hypothetical protein
VCLAIVAISVAAPSLLRETLHFLVVDEGTGPADYVVPLGGDQVYEQAPRLVREKLAQRVLLSRWHPSRIVRFNIIPPREALARHRLALAGIAAEMVDITPRAARTSADSLRDVAAWLAERSEATAIVLCPRLEGRRLALERDRYVEPALAQRMRIVAIADRELDERCWWRDRLSAKSLLSAWIGLAIEVCFGEMHPEPDDWDPDQYEKSLRSKSLHSGSHL